MGMPETSMQKNDGFVFGKHNVGPTGQANIIDPIAETMSEQITPDQQFTLGVLCPDARHDPASRFQRKTVTQEKFLPRG